MATTRSRPLFDQGQYDSKRWLDFAKLPRSQKGQPLIPTGLAIFEQGGDFLIYRLADVARGITGKQHAIFRALAGLSNFPDSPCNITVLVVTGIPESTERSWAIYDYMTTPEDQVRLKPTSTQEIQAYIYSWFTSRRGRR